MTLSPYPFFFFIVFLSLFAFYLSDKLSDGWTYIFSGKTLGRILSLCFVPLALQVIVMSIGAYVKAYQTLGTTLWTIAFACVFLYALLHIWNPWLLVFNTTTKTMQESVQALPGYRLRTDEEKRLSRMDDLLLPENTVIVSVSGNEFVVRVSRVFSGMCWLRVPGDGMKQEKQEIISMIAENIDSQFCSSSKQLGAYFRFYGILGVLAALATVLL